VKYCTLVKVRGGDVTEFIRCDAVDDGHRYGFTADRAACHLPGVHLPADRIVAFGMARGNMTDPYPVLTPCGHPEGTPDAG